jgi:methionyl-tRNA formyltransferase
MTEPGLSAIDPAIERANVLLLGNGPTALTALRSLVRSCNVLGVLRATSDADADPVRAHASRLGIAVWELDNPCELPNLIVKLRPEAVIISSFNRILLPDILGSVRFVNVHYSPLPRYRGRANVNWAIINGEPLAAISIHLVTPGLDDGNILFQEQVPIAITDTAQSVYDRLNAIQERELGPAVIRAVAGDPGSPQDHGQATYGCARIPDDGEIDWSKSSIAIDRLIRALTPPFPGAFTYLKRRRLVIVRAEPRRTPLRYEGRVPGRVVSRSLSEGWVDILTGDGILRLFEVLPESAEVLEAAGIIGSTRATLGLSRLDLLRWVDSLERRLAKFEAVAHAQDSCSRHGAGDL